MQRCTDKVLCITMQHSIQRSIDLIIIMWGIYIALFVILKVLHSEGEKLPSTITHLGASKHWALNQQLWFCRSFPCHLTLAHRSWPCDPAVNEGLAVNEWPRMLWCRPETALPHSAVRRGPRPDLSWATQGQRFIADRASLTACRDMMTMRRAAWSSTKLSAVWGSFHAVYP